MYSNFNCLADGREFVPQQKSLYGLSDKEDLVVLSMPVA